MKCKDCNYTDCPSRTSDAEKECVFSEGNIQLHDEWQGVRIQAAIAAMQGMLSNSCMKLEEGDTYPKVAVRYADALIEELKKKQQNLEP